MIWKLFPWSQEKQLANDLRRMADRIERKAQNNVGMRMLEAAHEPLIGTRFNKGGPHSLRQSVEEMIEEINRLENK